MPVDLIAVAQVRSVVAVVQVYEARISIVPSRTPEIRVEALAVGTTIVVPVAGRQRRERERIRAIAIAIPPGRGLEHCSGDR